MKSVFQLLVLTRYLGRRSLQQTANRLLGVCIVICSFVAASLGLFANSVQSALDSDIANYLGAPMVIRTEQAIPQDTVAWGGVNEQVRTASYTTGAISKGEYQSVSLKGVSTSYPIQGELMIERNGEGKLSLTANDLTTGSVWLDQSAMDELQLSLGDSVQIGRARLVVNGVIHHEPDRLTQWRHALPRAMVNTETLALTKVGINNDRGEHRVLLSGDEQALAELEASLSSSLTQNYEVLRPGKGRHPLSRLSLRAERMMNLLLVLVLILCGSAAAILSNYSTRNYAKPASVLRCMGVDRRAIVLSLCLQLMLLSLLASLIGFLVACLTHPWLIKLMQPHMNLSVSPPAFADLLAPISIGLLTVIAFVLPKQAQLASVSVSRVLRGEDMRIKQSKVSLLCVATLIVSLIGSNSDNTQLTVLLLGAVLVLVTLSIGSGWLLSKLSAQAHHFFSGPNKIAIRSIGRSPKRHITSLVSVAIAMMAILMTVTLRGSFLDVLQIHMLDTDGNYIFTGLPADQADGFINTLGRSSPILKNLHPTVSSKLVSINGLPINQVLKHESDTREETRSKVRLSWSTQLPDNNVLLNGHWPKPGSTDVSVESEVMSDLGLQIGDVLGFQIGDTVLNATISSEREYKAGGSRMMFWFMFAPQALASFESYYMGGLLLNDQAPVMLRKIANQFPQVRITNLKRQIDGIRNIMVVITRMMNTALLLLLCGALSVVMATAFVSASDRQKQSNLMRVIGLTKTQCYSMNLMEQLVVGLLSCLIGIIATQVIANAMFQNLFSLSYQLQWKHALMIVASICIAFMMLGGWFANRQLKQKISFN